MTGNDYKVKLGIRLDDVGENIFTPQIKMDAINSARRLLVSVMDNKYLGELETVDNDQSLSSGTVTFASAGIDPIRDGIIGIYDESNNKWCTMIEPGQVKSLQNTFLSGTTTSAVAYTFAETIYVNPTSISSVDIWYYKNPTDFTYSDSGSGSGGMASACELNAALQEIVVDMAEAQLWRIDGQATRGQGAMQNAMLAIQMLNGRIPKDLSEGIGTSGR